jgi:hypothetical protein
MSIGIDIETLGFADLMKRVSRIEGDVDLASVLAVNRAARDGRVLAAEQIGEEVNYPAGYLNKGRLKITKYATKSDVEAIIQGRDRPTMLSRFSRTRPRFGRQHGGVRVEVKPGRTQQLDNAFFMRLRNDNIGLVVRTKKGESLRHSRGAKKLSDGLYLLYGPSVNQAFRGVASDIAPEVTAISRDEFLRQFRRLNNGR